MDSGLPALMAAILTGTHQLPSTALEDGKCTVLYCTLSVLYCTVLYFKCTVLYCTVLYSKCTEQTALMAAILPGIQLPSTTLVDGMCTVLYCKCT